MYNHESTLRSPEFVTRKISLSVARIKLGLEDILKIGNLSAIRDWGHAPEYVDGMIRIIQYANPETFILASGRAATVRDFVRIAFEVVGIALSFEGTGLEEVGFDSQSGRELIVVDPRFFRPAEEIPLVGNAAKAKSLLGWEPLTSLEEIVKMMVSSDLVSLSDLGAR
jgi:GDPmannose 4,6-dehydratase